LAASSSSCAIMAPIFDEDLCRVRRTRCPLVHNVAQLVRELNEALEQQRRFAARKVEARRQSGLDTHFCC
jgi:hypothetical protein